MDRYFPVVSKPSSLRVANNDKDKKRGTGIYHPYRQTKRESLNCGGGEETTVKRKEVLILGGMGLSASDITKHLLSTLSDESNPITHSTIADRSDYVISTSTGHQVAEGSRDRQLYDDDRRRKLAIQREPRTRCNGGEVLKGVRVYINGFLSDTTDIEMKRIIAEAGGQNVMTPSGCTHILTSQQLSASKAHKLLTSEKRNKVHVVKPEWVFDSVRAGKRQLERKYTVMKNTTTHNLHEMWKSNTITLRES